MEDSIQPTIPTKQVSFARNIFFSIIVFCLFTVSAGTWLASKNIPPPGDFPINTVIEIVPGMSIQEIAKFLAEKKVVESELMLYAVLLTYYDPTDIKASDYVFTEPIDVFAVAQRLTEGDFDSTLISFTHREGERASEVAKNASAILEDFDSALFIEHALPYEGKLYPDTYRIPATYTADELLTLMFNAYETTMEPLRARIAVHDLTEEQIIILASIIEREANTPESMKMVSGILQNRLAIMMPLQVDASVEYILDKPLGELTPADLLVDSPYNTYRTFGLPPTPIGNPGLTSIMAVLEPTPSDYYFYITGNDGEFYYAKTFDEHKLNIARHLR